MSEPGHIHSVDVQFGDCDPAGIVFFPNFSRWMDAASLAFFIARGVPPWHKLAKTRGIIGTPILELNVRYLRAATYGERIEVHTRIDAWAARTFRHRRVVRRGADVLCEASETRAFVIPRPGRSGRHPLDPHSRGHQAALQLACDPADTQARRMKSCLHARFSCSRGQHAGLCPRAGAGSRCQHPLSLFKWCPRRKTEEPMPLPIEKPSERLNEKPEPPAGFSPEKSSWEILRKACFRWINTRLGWRWGGVLLKVFAPQRVWCGPRPAQPSSSRRGTLEEPAVSPF